MKSSLLLLLAFPILVSCNTPQVAPKEKTSVEPTQPSEQITRSPMVGQYVKINIESNIFLPGVIDIAFVEERHQLLLNEGRFEIVSTGNAAYLHTKQDLAFAPRSIKSVEIIHDWQLSTSGDDTYRLILTYWGNESQSQTIEHTATYKKVVVE